MPWLKIMSKIISPGALHLLLDFDNFNTKEDSIQDIFRDLGLGETFFKGCITVRVTCKNL